MTTKIKSGLIADNAIVSAHISSGAISSAHLSSIDTDNVSEGSSNLYFTTARARTSLSITDSGGDGSLAYNNSTGAITYTGPSAAEVRAHLSAGTGVTYSSGAISIGQSVATTASPTFADINVTGNINVTGDLNTVSVADLDVQDKTITLGAGQNEASSGGSGIVVDGSGASLLWDESNDEWDFNKSINVTGTIQSSGNITGTLATASQPNITSLGTLTNLTVDDITINGSTISDAGTLTLDVAGNLILDADGGGVAFKDGGVEFGLIEKSSNNIQIYNTISDGDIVFKGYDSGSGITALTLDMSAAGAATFNSNITIKDLLNIDSSDNTTDGFLQAGDNLLKIGTSSNDTVAFYANNTAHMKLKPDGEVIINETGNAEGDLRVESSGNVYMLLVDAANNRVGIGTSNPAQTLDVKGRMQLTRPVASGHASEGNWDFNISHEDAARYGSLYITPSVSTAEISLMSNKFRFTNTGRLGIGTATPARLLEVSGNGGKSRFTRSGSAGTTMEFYSGGSQAGGIQVQSTGLGISGGTGENHVFINTSGNVGIGTDSPTSYYSRSLVVSASAEQGITIAATGTSMSNYIMFADGTTGNEAYRGYIAYSHTNDKMAFAAGGEEKMYIDNSGNVGIGTDNPTDPLTIHNGTPSIAFKDTSSNGTMAFTLDGTTLSLFNKSTGGDFTFGTANTERMRITSDGGLQFPDNNTFIATSNVAGGTAYEWGAIRRPAGSDGGQLSIRQYSSGDTAAGYPALAGGSTGWDENTGVYFPAVDQVGFTAGGNPTLTVEAGKQIQRMANGFTNSNGMYRTCLGGFGHATTYNPGSSGTGTYMHFKTNVAKNNKMFRFEYRGYGYNANNIDTSICGYTYESTSYVYSPVIQDTGDTTCNFKTPYYSSDNKLVLVIQITNNYTGGVMWAQFVGSHHIAGVAITSTKFSSSATGAY